jgi:hypothetical protein
MQKFIYLENGLDLLIWKPDQFLNGHYSVIATILCMMLFKNIEILYVLF